MSRKFYDATADIEQLRPETQHSRGEIRSLAETNQPAWGVLTRFSRYEGS